MSGDEEAIVSKVRDLMSALDKAKQYRGRVTSIVDFVVVFLFMAVAGVALDLAVTYLFYAYGIGSDAGLVPTVLAVVIAGTTGGAVAANRRMRRIRVGQWEEDLKEGFPGALKILTSLDWGASINDARIARLGSVLYGFLRVAGYTLVFSALLDVGIAFSRFALFWPSGGINVVDPFGFALAFAFIVVTAASARDLERRFRESSSLDSLVWELRWFYTGFTRSEFKA